MRKFGILYMVLAAMATVPMGCGGYRQAEQVGEPLRLQGAARTDVMQAAEDVLARMHFPIEKLDIEQGIIRTGPLRAGQLFEFWRSDNVGPANAAEANLQTIRRAIELRVTDDNGALRVDCDVWVQRLSLPENEVAGVSQAYGMHSKSSASLQTLELTPEQQRSMVWMDLGKDPRLAAEIVRRIAKKLRHPEEEAT